MELLVSGDNHDIDMQIAHLFLIFLERAHALNNPGMRAAIIISVRNSNLLYKILLKYTLKCINCNMFLKIFSGAKTS